MTPETITAFFTCTSMGVIVLFFMTISFVISILSKDIVGFIFGALGFTIYFLYMQTIPNAPITNYNKYRVQMKNSHYIVQYSDKGCPYWFTYQFLFKDYVFDTEKKAIKFMKEKIKENSINKEQINKYNKNSKIYRGNDDEK